MSLNMYLYNENQKDHSFKSWTKNYALDYSICLICNIKNSSQISHLNSKELKRIVKGLTKAKSNIEHNRSDNIKYKDITAQNIKADDISYYALCFAYNNIKCKTITGRRNKHKHFVLDGELMIKNNNW